MELDKISATILSILGSSVVTGVKAQPDVPLSEEEFTMDYLIINHRAEDDDGPAPGTPAFGEMMGHWMAYNQMLIDNGHWIGGASLTPSVAATSVAKSGDSVKVTDGPFAETKEQIAGYYVIKADDLDEAIRLAQAMPTDDVVFEIRPIAFRPDA